MTKILLVEDHEMNRDMLLRRLKRRGYDVLEAGDAEMALTLAATDSPDLILMDMALPGMNGWEATSKLKGDPQTAGIPIIGLSAHAMSGDRQKGLAAGCDEYDTKPIDFPRLLGKIQSFIKTDA